MDDDFDLMALPQHIHNQILEKFTYQEHARFRSLNNFCHELSKSNSSRMFPVEVKHFYFQNFWTPKGLTVMHSFQLIKKNGKIGPQIALEGFPQAQFNCSLFSLHVEFTDDIAPRVLEIIEKHRIRCEKLHFLGMVVSGFDSFTKLIENLPCKHCHFEEAPNGHLELEVIQKIPFLEINNGFTVNDEIFLEIPSKHLHIHTCVVTTAGIVTYLKQWQDHKREIVKIRLRSLLVNKNGVWDAFGLDLSADVLKIERKEGDTLEVKSEGESIVIAKEGAEEVKMESSPSIKRSRYS